MNFWILLWKWLFILSLLGFGVLTVWVTIWGAGDIKSLLDTVGKQHQQDTDTKND